MSEQNGALVKNKEASITTTGIDIKCLRVDGRNLTMSVFRQIPKKWFFGEDGVRGSVWGWVNYFWKNEQGKYHVIWEMDGKLYRYPTSRTNLRKMYGYYDCNKKIHTKERHISMGSEAEKIREEINQLKKKRDEIDEWIDGVLESLSNYEQLYIAT